MNLVENGSSFRLSGEFRPDTVPQASSSSSEVFGSEESA